MIWCKRGLKTVNKNYLLGLVLCHRHSAAGVAEIPHLRSSTYYADLLRQIGIKRGKGRSKAPLALQADDGSAWVPHSTVRPKVVGAVVAKGAQDVPSEVKEVEAAQPRSKRSAQPQPRTYAWGPT